MAGIPSEVGSPEHWRKRAKESRAIADQIGDSDAKAKMLAVAESYEKMATRAEARMKKRLPSLSWQ